MVKKCASCVDLVQNAVVVCQHVVGDGDDEADEADSCEAEAHEAGVGDVVELTGGVVGGGVYGVAEVNS